MTPKFLPTAAAAALLALLAAGAQAEITSQSVIDAYAAEGYTRIEVKNGPTQIKVEAIRGDTKVEVVYDRATGDTLEREVERVRSGDDTSPGVEVGNRDEDFVEDSEHGRGRDDDDDEDEDDDDDHSGSGGDSDDDDHDDDDGDDDHDDDGDDGDDGDHDDSDDD